MSRKGNNRNGMRFKIAKPDEKELSDYRKEINRCMDDLDWAMQTYGVTLKELGWTEKEVSAELNSMFWSKIKSFAG